MNQIPIVMTSDDNYAFQTSVTIMSILDHKNENTDCIFYVLNNGKLTVESKNVIEKFHSNIHFLTVDPQKFQNIRVLEHVPIASFYRILISDILAGIDRCLFIDGDTIIMEDLFELFTKDLHNNYVAGVKDCGIQYSSDIYKDYADKLGIQNMKTYINAGVLVMNLQKIREDNLVEEFILHMNKNYLMMDQDVINVCCYGKIEILPLEYNTFFEFYNQLDKLSGTIFSNEEIKSAIIKIKIIHFAGKYKPWNNIRCKNGNLWWNYAKQTLNSSIYEKLLDSAEKWCELRDWSYVISRCKNKKSIVVCGFSEIGKSVYRAIKANENNVVCIFCDNDLNKQGQLYDGLTILSMDNAIKQYENACFVISSQGYYSQIREQLQENEINIENIVGYFSKNSAYYEYLAEEYYQKEIEESLLFRFGSTIEMKSDIDIIIRKLKSGVKYEDAIELLMDKED